MIKLQQHYFSKYQKLLLWFLSEKEGKNRVGIPTHSQIVYITPTAFHEHLDGKQYKVTAYTRNVFAEQLGRALTLVDAHAELGDLQSFTDAKEVFLHGMGYRYSRRAELYLDTTGDLYAVADADGNIYIDNGGTWATVRNAASGTAGAAGDPVNIYASQLTSRSISRGFFPYANPGIPSGSMIDSGTFKFTCTSVVAGSPVAHLVRSTQASISTLANDDYDNITEVPSTGAVTSCGSVAVTAAQKTITLNATGLAHITPGADILFALMEQGDQSNTDPVTLDNRFSMNTSNNGTAGNKPTLSIVYTPPLTQRGYALFV